MIRWALIGLLLCAGCQRQGQLGAADRRTQVRAMPVEDTGRRIYLAGHDNVTRKLVLYRGFATALMMRATLLTPPFRRMMASERERLLGPALTDADAEAFRGRMQADAEAYHEVVFAADSGMASGDTFAPDDSGWQLRLHADGVEQTLVSLERIRRPNAMHRTLFPQLDLWATLYAARFERTVDQPRRIELHVGSGYGHGTLVWDLVGG